MLLSNPASDTITSENLKCCSEEAEQGGSPSELTKLDQRPQVGGCEDSRGKKIIDEVGPSITV